MSIQTTFQQLKRRRTKIVATLGPASSSPTMLRQMIEAGVGIFRLNMSHGDHETHRQTYTALREAATALKCPIAILADLCGPKIRVGHFRDGSILLEEGETVTVTTRDVEGDKGLIPCSYKALAQDVVIGDRILMADGLFELQVAEVQGTEVLCRVVQGGILHDRKGINLPGVNISEPSLTAKDRKDAAFALELGVDFLALSFVRRSSDMQELRAIVTASGQNTKLIAKIEKPEALEDIDGIIQASDGLMVARGDLGVEMAAESVPLIQDQLVRRARVANRPVIVATQMLESMIKNARPTRAEVADVAHAVSSGTDAVMLSGETAVGDHPIEAIRTMDRIARKTESHQWDQSAFGLLAHPSPQPVPPPIPLPDAVANASALLSRELQVRALVVPSNTGTTARVMSASRPAAPILGISDKIQTCAHLNLLWGVIPLHLDNSDQFKQHPRLACALVEELELASQGQSILLVQNFSPDPQLNAPTISVLTI